MNPEIEKNNIQDMDPAEYLNSISSSTPMPASQDTTLGVPLNNSKPKKWPVITVIVVVIVLIVAWLTAIVVSKNVANDEVSNDRGAAEENFEDVIMELTCSRALDDSELAFFNSNPLSGERSYSIIYDSGNLDTISQYTELTYTTNEMAEKAEVDEAKRFEDYYKNTLSLAEDPFNSMFMYLEENTMSMNFDVEKNEMDLDDSERFVFPEGDNLNMNNAQIFYENAGYDCSKVVYPSVELELGE